MKRLAHLLLRLCLVAYFVVSAFYCVLAYNPFTFRQVVEVGLIGGLAAFVKFHPWVHFVAVACAACTLTLDSRRLPERTIDKVYLVGLGLMGLFLAVRPVLSRLSNDSFSLLWAHVFLLPLFGLFLVDVAARQRFEREPEAEPGLPDALMGSLVTATALVSVGFGVLAYLRKEATLESAFPVLGSLHLHGLLFMGAFLSLLVVHGLASVLPGRSRTEFALGTLWVGACLTAVFRGLIFPGIALSGPIATWLSVLLGLALASVLAGTALRLERADGTGAQGLRSLFSPLALGADRAVWLQAVSVLFTLVLGATLMVQVSAMDWNGLLQQLIAIATWALVFSALLGLPLGRGGATPARRVLAYVLFACVLVLVRVTTERGWLGMARASTSEAQFAEWVEREPSLRVVEAALRNRSQGTADASLFPFLQRNTNLLHDFKIAPVDVAFRPDLARTPGEKPDIFVIVIDSLRRDYLSPFNREVTFTPFVAEWAKESDVFQNAFSHYGATGLSEPSIWVGGMMPHKQYITPFGPLNALEKLLIAEQYTRAVSVDSILDVILTKDENLEPLDATVAPRDYDLCRTLEELKGKIEARPATSRPLFVYTQPQNVHIARINREPPNVPAGLDYTGFHPPYAHRVRQLDACLGAFVGYLKQTGRWDKSLLVLTADHGDALGEGGRWGHAYTIYPEILRIPLIVHVPSKWRQGLEVDLGRPVFSTDLTPTFYDLLGHPPTPPSEAFGLPLYGRGKRPAGHASDAFLVVSSYGPVYGILEANATRLYIADAINLTEHYYDLTNGFAGAPLSVSADVRGRNQRRIREGIEEIHEFYRVGGLP